MVFISLNIHYQSTGVGPLYSLGKMELRAKTDHTGCILMKYRQFLMDVFVKNMFVEIPIKVPLILEKSQK